MTHLMRQMALVAATATTLACGGSTTTDNREPPEAPEVSGMAGAANQTTSREAQATLTGCLQRGNQSGTYVLRVASDADVTPPATTGTSGSGATAAAADWAGARSFLVTPPSRVDLREHVNARVAVTGAVDMRDTTGLAASRDESQRPHGGVPMDGMGARRQ